MSVVEGLDMTTLKIMHTSHLIIQSISRYKSFYRLIAIAVIIAVAVITGSLVVGDSVRSTLVERVNERLGKTETVIFSRYGYLDDDICELLDIGTDCKSAPVALSHTRGMLWSNGFVSISGTLIPVTVWGVDDLNIQKGHAKINQALFDELKSSQINDLVLRLPANGMVPSGSMFVTDVYTTSLRLELDSIVSVEQGGNLNLKNEQTILLNIFVNRDELAETMGVSGKINLILSDQYISKNEFNSAWNYALSGLHVDIENQTINITSDRIFIQDKIVETIGNIDILDNRYFSYLANSIHNHKKNIPYSFITAVDYFNGKQLNSNEIILSDYAAKRLGARVNDEICVNYFISRQFKTLITDSIFLKVGKIVPLADLQADSSLRADFPGLSNVERCTDWNSDLPIDMSLITSEDEAYWAKYKHTPKALVPYSALSKRWENAYGSATALRIRDTNRLKNLLPEMFDIQILYPRESAVVAAKSGVDFSSLFLSLGFFIILSAALLMIVPLSEMLFRRRDEIKLLQAVGFPKKRILRLFWREATPTVIVSAIIGVIVGLIYTYVILFLLGNVWKGATHTEGFRVFPHVSTIAAGLIVGLILSLMLVYFCIQKRVKGERLKVKGKRFRRSLLTLNPLTLSTLIRASLRYSRKQAILSFVSLASGVLIVFAVGLNRRSFADSSEIRTATGGFSLWCETRVPVYHNVQTEEGRAKLGLKDLFETPVGVGQGMPSKPLQLLKYSADDASCLNLNKVATPNVLGIDMDDLKNSDFKISKTIFGDSDSTVFEKFTTAENAVYPALVDETVLTWGLMKKLGDTLIYTGENGEKIAIQLAGTLKNSIFQGHILLDKKLFSQVWSEISGSEIMLLRVPDKEIDDTKTLISQALNNYGVRIMTTGERMKLFYSVTDTYLTIFLTLGGLGLLLGMFSFIIVVRKNILAKRQDIMLYRSLGFDEKRIFNLLYKENIIIPLCAIAVGVLGSLPGVSMGFGNVSVGIWALAAAFLVIFVLCVMVFVKTCVKRHLRLNPTCPPKT